VRQYEEDRRRAQASRVVCWLTVAPSTATFTPSGGGPSTTVLTDDHLELVLHNGSDEPVFDCRIQVVLEPPVSVLTTPDIPWQLTITERMLPPGRPSVRNGTSVGPTIPTRTYGCCSPTRTTSGGSAATPAGSAGLVDSSTRPRRSAKDRINAWTAGKLDDLPY
jgi:hypothetical protein